ncbi:alanine racemase [Salisaeta longa]|uniref:alanine racemase n=1 Tax=Salisaeta longa TaxID=503170 RepID=UPI0003B46944|nr:alanine racemase [Salisaeta longa]
MATLRINTAPIIDNIKRLSTYLSAHDVQWTLVAKVLNGHRAALEALLTSEAMNGVHSIADSRLSGIRTMKAIRPDIRTMYIKPPAVELADDVVQYADVSLNSSLTTIQALNDAAAAHNTTHRIIIMVELGELREGIVRDDLLDFYDAVFELPHVEVIGLGSNLGCMHGVEPNYDKMVQLCLYQQLIEASFNRELPLVSGTSSIGLPHVGTHKLPDGVNHLRIGEAAFFGTSPLHHDKVLDLSSDTFVFAANIIEKARKDPEPEGVINDANIGHTAQPVATDRRTDRCITDFGLLDVDVDNLTPVDEGVQFAGTTSDMTVFDVSLSDTSYAVGDRIAFRPNYMATAHLMLSKYMDKAVG